MPFFKLSNITSRFLVLAGLALLAAAMLTSAACGGEDTDTPVLTIGGIPDQDISVLTRRFETVSNYLSEHLDLEVRYIPSVSYAALVTAFEQGEIHLGWFGSLTGAQARAAAPGSQAIVQRSRDASFHSVFIAGPGVEADELQDLEGLTFTFGSESSSSGHLMPRYHMVQEGIDPDADLSGVPGYSGSHDKTWQLVETGSYQAGALSEAVWESAVENGRVDTSRVRAFYTTPPYHNYNWTVHAEADAIFGDGFTTRLQELLISMDPSEQVEGEILDLFNAESFMETNNDNYRAIEEIARDLDIIR